jgi:hypothetical protein
MWWESEKKGEEEQQSLTPAEKEHAKQVDQKVKDIEGQIMGTFDRTQDEGLIQFPFDTDPSKRKTKYGLHALKIAVQSPNYVVRGITWPVAVVVKEAIKAGVVEKLIDAFSNKARTFWVYPVFEIGFGYSFGGGVGVKHSDLFHKNYKFHARYLIRLSLDQEAEFSLGKPDVLFLGKHEISFNTRAKWFRYYDNNFYGEGPSSKQGDHAIYGIDDISWGANVAYEFLNNFRLFGELGFATDVTRSGEGGRPSVEKVFTPAELPGFKKFVFYIVPELKLQYDNRDSEFVPGKGGQYFFSVRRFQGLNRIGFDYNEYECNAEHFFTAWSKKHVFAVRMNWMFQHDIGGGVVPFYRLATLDVYTPLRGFSEGRFADKARVVFNVEYRFPVWSFVEGDIFFDTGRVFHGPMDFSFKRFRFAGGGGISFRTNNYFLARLQAGYGGEGVKIMFKTSQSF